MSIKTIATVLAKTSQVQATTEVIARASALWKFAWAANNATDSPKDEDEFKATQQELTQYLLDAYKTNTIKAAERKMARLGSLANQLAEALVENDTRQIVRIMQQTHLGLQQIGVLATIVAFYSAAEE